MNFYKLKTKHKFWFIINKLIMFTMLIVALAIAWNVNDVVLETAKEKTFASVGFIITVAIFSMALLNRLSTIFKIKSMGFIVFLFMFIGLRYILDPVISTISIMLVPLLIDDIIFKGVWNNIWYNEYDGYVRIQS